MASSHQTASSRQALKRIFRACVGVTVVGCLILATNRAVDQWQATTAMMQAEVDRIESALAEAARSEPPSPPVIEQLREDLDRAKSRIPSLADFRWDRMGLAGLLYALGLLPPGWLLGSLVTALGGKVRRSTAMSAQLIGHAGKYIPGKVAVVVIRAGVMSGEGVPLITSTIGVFVETFLMMAVGGAIASLILLFLPVPVWLMAVGIATALVAGAPTLPPVLATVAAKLTRTPRDQLRRQLTWPVVAQAWAWSTLSWILIGGSFAMILASVPSIEPLPSPTLLYPIATAAIALSMAVGFASLLPGGVGVRELVLLSTLAVVTDFAHGMFAAIAARFLFIAIESVLAGGIWTHRRFSGRASGDAAKLGGSAAPRDYQPSPSDR